MNHGRLQYLVRTERGMMEGMREASMVLPDPGGPIMSSGVTAGRGDLEGPLGRLVTRDLREVERLDGRHRTARPRGPAAPPPRLPHGPPEPTTS